MKMDGYELIEEALNLDHLKYYDYILVTIRINDCITTELLSYDGCNFIWENDWWEGEQDIEFIGAAYLSDIKVNGNQLSYN